MDIRLSQYMSLNHRFSLPLNIQQSAPCRVSLVVSMSATHTEGRGFASQSRVIPKTIIKMVQTASQHRHACVRVGV